ALPFRLLGLPLLAHLPGTRPRLLPHRLLADHNRNLLPDPEERTPPGSAPAPTPGLTRHPPAPRATRHASAQPHPPPAGPSPRTPAPAPPGRIRAAHVPHTSGIEGPSGHYRARCHTRGAVCGF